MSANANWQLRKVCLAAIRQCEQAEQRARQTGEAATRQRRANLAEARQRHDQARKQAETLVREARRLAQQGDQSLTKLGLTAGSPTPFAPPSGASLDELARLLHNSRSQARDALNRLRATVKALEEERRKWWKFW